MNRSERIIEFIAQTINGMVVLPFMLWAAWNYALAPTMPISFLTAFGAVVTLRVVSQVVRGKS